MEGITPVIVAGAWPPTTHNTAHWCPGWAMSDSMILGIIKAIQLTQPVKQMCLVDVFVLARLSACPAQTRYTIRRMEPNTSRSQGGGACLAQTGGGTNRSSVYKTACNISDRPGFPWSFRFLAAGLYPPKFLMYFNMRPDMSSLK